MLFAFCRFSIVLFKTLSDSSELRLQFISFFLSSRLFARPLLFFPFLVPLSNLCQSLFLLQFEVECGSAFKRLDVECILKPFNVLFTCKRGQVLVFIAY
jgi:hypothetical protein